MHLPRRDLLAAGATLGAGTLAGCLGGVTSTGADRDVIRLQSLDIGGSPGGEIALRPPGTVTLLDFFATWCAPCKPQMDNLRTIRAEFPESDLFLASITGETDEAAIRAFWREHEGTWPVVMDEGGDATREYEVTGIPTLVLVSPDGEHLWRHRGLAGVDQLRTEISRAIEET